MSTRPVQNTQHHPLFRWKEKNPVEVYNEVKTAYGDKAKNCTSVFKTSCIVLYCFDGVVIAAQCTATFL